MPTQMTIGEKIAEKWHDSLPFYAEFPNRLAKLIDAEIQELQAKSYNDGWVEGRDSLHKDKESNAQRAAERIAPMLFNHNAKEQIRDIILNP